MEKKNYTDAEIQNADKAGMREILGPPQDNLNKENFWNAMMMQFPSAMNLFCNWIDEYKKQVGWDNFFKDGVKFHDIPFQMQGGIIAKFLTEMHKQPDETAESFKPILLNFFKELERTEKKKFKVIK